MTLHSLEALSPIDGRYYSKTKSLRAYFSEEALIRYRVRIEIEYFIALSNEIPQLTGRLSHEQIKKLREVYESFTSDQAQEVKEIEAVTNHDVKAVEYFIKKVFDSIGLEWAKEFVHFGLTSQDINNTAFPLMLKEALDDVFLPALTEVIEKIEKCAEEWEHVPMLARTHGQPASPTRLGKEFKVYSYRLKEQLNLYNALPHGAKFGGATGNFNAHKVAYPTHKWIDFANAFVSFLGLHREQVTTQISNYDHLAALFDNLARINTILIDLSRDIWTYISMGYFRQKIKAGEVGSSAMPHKVNPIDFENAEGNLAMANAIYHFLSTKLPISRLQRDLTDSTVIRNEGMPLAYSLIALTSLSKGFDKIILNPEALKTDLEQNYEVVAEAIQTILRREGYPNPYEALKDLTRTGEAMTAERIIEFIDKLDVSDRVKQEMKEITPETYVGL
ncbi:adenylosuccinate lyase [Porphyromonas circumdentaria]|uniref:Adenylosuccinate lyase n=1 Tax=Porphyromonas circumdentaria TaxID=29524 RepID=A0A1T4NIZ1_9PORP|nr:adenylosuccinate lyase [Porphyromonas circumdentaria]MBB6276103.1 adenylosuccinate lyase [Porphyromonas circumdentaria]SJZ79270.1 Adenylosuccinate lyase [Porphyromonas circumdentaria]